MDFADYLDEIARPAETYGRASGSGRPVATSFWDVLERVASEAPVTRTAVDEAYFQSERDAAESQVPPVAPSPGELSLDPDDIAFELDLDSVLSLEELSVLRRRFARLNHPDRMPETLKADANTRMTIANAMIDKAEMRLSG